MEKVRRLTGNQLKIIAVITMLIDHIAYALIAEGLWNHTSANAAFMGISPDTMVTIYTVMRSVGRIAFVIYAFFLVDGYFRTSNWKKYALRLGVLAFISEIPFDFMERSQYVSWDAQNVFFTLFIGLSMIRLLDGIEKRDSLRSKGALQILCVAAAAYLALLLRTDYSYIGIILLAIFYYTRKKPEALCLWGCLWMSLDVISIGFVYVLGYIAAFIILYLYSGQRGKRPGKVVQWAFYFVYPLHLALLCFIRKYMF